MKQIYLKETRKNKNKQQREETPVNKHDIKNFSYFDRDLLWWQQSIQYGNAKIPRFILTPYKLFPVANKSERAWFYETNENGK